MRKKFYRRYHLVLHCDCVHLKDVRKFVCPISGCESLIGTIPMIRIHLKRHHDGQIKPILKMGTKFFYGPKKVETCSVPKNLLNNGRFKGTRQELAAATKDNEFVPVPVEGDDAIDSSEPQPKRICSRRRNVFASDEFNCENIDHIPNEIEFVSVPFKHEKDDDIQLIELLPKSSRRRHRSFASDNSNCEAIDVIPEDIPYFENENDDADPSVPTSPSPPKRKKAANYNITANIELLPAASPNRPNTRFFKKAEYFKAEMARSFANFC